MRKGVHAKTYNAWRDMKKRCSNPTRRDYRWYGGRGIAVCPEWMDYDNFLRDMGEAPDGMSIDRIDSNGDYALGQHE